MAFGMNLGKKSLVRPGGVRPGVTATSPIKDNVERMAEYKAAQRAKAPDALERMIAYKRSRGELPSQQTTQKTTVVPKPTPAPKPVAAPIPEAPVTSADLAALTTDQRGQVFNEYEKLRRQYDVMQNQLNQQESLAQIANTADVRAANRSGAYQQQDLMTQLAALGMDAPSGLTQVGAQEVAANTQAELDKASSTLADVLAKVKSEREQATTQRELGNLDIENLMLQLRIQNARAAQEQAQKIIGGLQ